MCCSYDAFFQDKDPVEYMVDCLFTDSLHLVMGTHRFVFGSIFANRLGLNGSRSWDCTDLLALVSLFHDIFEVPPKTFLKMRPAFRVLVLQPFFKEFF